MPLLAQHEFADGWCKHCGLRENEHSAQYGCLQRSIHQEELCPEPTRRQMACEAADEIAARIVEIEKERLAAVNEPA